MLALQVAPGPEFDATALYDCLRVGPHFSHFYAFHLQNTLRTAALLFTQTSELNWNETQTKCLGFQWWSMVPLNPHFVFGITWPEKMWWGILQGTWWHFKQTTMLKKNNPRSQWSEAEIGGICTCVFWHQLKGKQQRLNLLQLSKKHLDKLR